MGQAWCKEKTTKAQDSKSPLDRVFVRCAHRIYPSLKEEGSVLGGATQRVTSSEIGYAGSPPRHVLQRNQSIDSVDRPFHPSDWVDVNLEVPTTPRSNSLFSNSRDARSYLVSSTPLSNSLKDVRPIPPPRKRRKNRGRPLPPKPDDNPEPQNNLKRVDTNEEPFYSSVKSPTKSEDYFAGSEDDAVEDVSRTKEVFEHKVNGTGWIIPSDVVSGRSRLGKKTSRTNCDEFARTKSFHDLPDRPASKQKSSSRDDADTKRKNCSTVSLPNYDELETSSVNEIKAEGAKEMDNTASSLPVESFFSARSQISTVPDASVEDSADRLSRASDGSVDKDNDSIEKEVSTKNERNIPSAPLSLQKPEFFGKSPSTSFDSKEENLKNVDEWINSQNRPRSIYDPPDMSMCKSATVCESNIAPVHKEPFYLVEQNKQSTDSIESKATRSGATDTSRTIFERSLAEENEPFESYYESKDLSVHASGNLVRTISKESLPHEMLGEVVEEEEEEEEEMEEERNEFDEKQTKDIRNKLTQESQIPAVVLKTPPPSPEPKIKPEILSNDHSTLLKVLREEACTSNLSSMTPSLNELEAALSDMLEKEDDRTMPDQSEGSRVESPVEPAECSIEREIVPIDKSKGAAEAVDGKDSENLVTVVARSPTINRKVSFCAWEEYAESAFASEEKPEMRESKIEELPEARESKVEDEKPEAKTNDENVARAESERADKLSKNVEDEDAPTPPRRKRRSSLNVTLQDASKANQSGANDPCSNDRLI